jgi:type II secretory pathway pseudopilin PulG
MGLFKKAVPRLKGNIIMKRQKAFALLQLLFEVMITLFIAGIVVPSLLRSDSATNEALAAGFLRTINIAGIAFSYTQQNVDFAILGASVGAMAALAITFPLRAKIQPQSEQPL